MLLFYTDNVNVKEKNIKGKNGFTLIELLAVIVILAIIVLIATPIVLGLISRARKGAATDAAYGVRKEAYLVYLTTITASAGGATDTINLTISEYVYSVSDCRIKNASDGDSERLIEFVAYLRYRLADVEIADSTPDACAYKERYGGELCIPYGNRSAALNMVKEYFKWNYTTSQTEYSGVTCETLLGSNDRYYFYCHDEEYENSLSNS